MASRGFIAELQRQSRLAAKRREQAQRAAAKEQAAAQRRHEKALRDAERAQAAEARATAADQKRAAAEAKRLHVEARQAEAEALTADLVVAFDEVDALLPSALDLGVVVDLESLRVVAQHPPFARPDLERQLPPPTPIQPPPEPVYVEPAPPKGLFGSKKKHTEAVAAAQAAFAAAHQAWQAEVARIPGLQLQQMQDYQQAEESRQRQLTEATEAHSAICARLDAEAAEANLALDNLIAGLANGDPEAVTDYVGLVFANSAYPDCFEVDHVAAFDGDTRELTLRVTVPGPSSLSDVREFRYNKAKDEIVEAKLTQKAQKDRYAAAVQAVALRSMHEVFSDDRLAPVETISLVIDCSDIDPATGQEVHVEFVAVAADRASFTSFDLSNVVPLATLQLLNAQVSKNPTGLVGIDSTRGVRGR